MNLEIFFQLRRPELMEKVRIKEIAEELGIKSKKFFEKAMAIPHSYGGGGSHESLPSSDGATIASLGVYKVYL